MTEQPSIYFFCGDFAEPIGGMRITYRHVDLLNRLGFRACIVHQKRGFRCTWFENTTPATSREEAEIRPNDIIVFPEVVEPRAAEFYPGVKKLIFNQNCYTTFFYYGMDKQDSRTPYTNRDVLGVIVVSQDSAEYLSYVFPGLRIYRCHYSISPRLFYPSLPKKRQICFMPRKNRSDALQVINILRFRGGLRDYEVRPIDNVPIEQAAAIMRESAIFLSFGHPEGFGLPPAEAMACGCLVVGYHGRGGREFFRPDMAYPIELGDILGYAHTVEWLIRELDERPDRLREVALHASEVIRTTWTESREEADLAQIWADVLNRARQIYCYHFLDTVVNDFSAFSGLPTTEIEARINHFSELTSQEWKSLPGGDYAEKAARFYGQTQSYIYDLLAVNYRKEAAIAKLNATSPQVLAALQAHPGRKFLEFGGGVGLVCEIAAGLGKEVTYLDLPGLVSDFAAWRFKRCGLPIRVALSDPRALRLNETYDIVFSDAVLEHVADPEQAITELCTHVNPGGLFILLVDLHGPTETFPMHRTIDIVRIHELIERWAFRNLLGRGSFCSIWAKPG